MVGSVGTPCHVLNTTQSPPGFGLVSLSGCADPLLSPVSLFSHLFVLGDSQSYILPSRTREYKMKIEFIALAALGEYYYYLLPAECIVGKHRLMVSYYRLRDPS
jgi:hypothetical protein